MACKHLHIVNTYTVTTGSTMATLNFVKPITSATDKERFCIKVCTDIPETYDTYTTQILINDSGVPLWNKYGNPLTVADLKKCKVMKGYYGSTTPHVILVDVPCNYGCNCNGV